MKPRIRAIYATKGSEGPGNRILPLGPGLLTWRSFANMMGGR